MSSDAVEALREAGAAVDRAIREIRRIWATDEELEAIVNAEVHEELAPEAPSHPRPGGHDWRETFRKNWLPWGGRRDRRRRRR